MAGRFDGKQALVLGVANKRSIAWAIAQRLHEEGAELAFTFQGERIEKGVRELAESVEGHVVGECDVRSDADLDRVFADTATAFGGGLDCLVHSVAFAAARGSRGPVHRHAARPLLAGGRHQRLLAGRGCEARGAADAGARRRLDRDDDVSRRRAGGAALQRDGCREGDPRRVRPLPRLGSRAVGHSRQRNLCRPGADAGRALDRRLHDDGRDVRAARAAASAHGGRRLRRRRCVPPVGATAAT